VGGIEGLRVIHKTDIQSAAADGLRRILGRSPAGQNDRGRGQQAAQRNKPQDS
jgi:hypothetical protein